jgi:cytochrome c-type biogenesis protein CcmH
VTAALAVALLVLGQGYAPSRQGLEPLGPEQEVRVQALGRQLRCAVCQGVSIADSPASMARAQLDTVRKLVAEGKSDQEVLDYFVERYGEWALLEPRKSGVTLFLWLAPFGVLVLGVALVVWGQRRGDGPRGGPGPSGAGQPPASDDAYLDQVRADLDR